jgi:glyoxylase-like metal-dependent hydrolase (beta-lactamase superfamily II)
MGSITLIAEIDDTRIAFCGDLMHEGGKLYQLHAMEYEYGDLAGVNWTAQSLAALRKHAPDLILPSHGPAIRNPAQCLDQLDERLHRLLRLQPDRVGATPDGFFVHEIKMQSITPHLLWGTDATCSNFYVLKTDSGKSMFIDYPYASAALFGKALHSPEPFATLRFVEHHLDELRTEWGVSSFDVVIPTHIHDDHVVGIPFLQKHHGTQCWSLEDVAKVLEKPERWNTPCLLETPIRLDRRLRDRETFTWEGIPFEIVFYPGQTEFHSAILAEIDGRRVLFAGDSSYPLQRYLPERTSEWMVNTVMRNSLTLSMHRKCAEEFERLRPDLLCPGHGPVWDVPEEAYAAHRRYVEEKEALWRELLPEPADLGIDLVWARLLPYQLRVGRGESAEVTLELRNPYEQESTFEATLSSSTRLRFLPTRRKVTLAARSAGTMTFKVSVPKDAWHHPFRRYLLTATLSVNGKSHGPVTEALVIIPS